MTTLRPEVRCVGATDACGQVSGVCPCCELVNARPPKRWRSPRVCPRCGDRCTKIFHLSTGKYECQICDHRYDPPERRA